MIALVLQFLLLSSSHACAKHGRIVCGSHFMCKTGEYTKSINGYCSFHAFKPQDNTPSSKSVSTVSSAQRIGADDGTVDGLDYAVIMSVTGNDNGDYVGTNTWNLSGENETKNEYTGVVTITSKFAGSKIRLRVCAPAFHCHPPPR